MQRLDFVEFTQQEDGSFSPFGHFVDRRGSVWITALTVSALKKAEPYTNIDPKVVSDAMAWLVKNQVPTETCKDFVC